jgi:hypothetical protein
MCTVTYLPTGSSIIITSNRDEKKVRSIAQPPAFYNNGKYKLYYPKDEVSQGTWFISNQKGYVGVLLNGAGILHESKPPYKLSRGTILPIIFQSDHPLQALQRLELTGIENCTIILFVQQKLYQCRWDGSNLEQIELDKNIPHVWSSITLYEMAMIEERHAWFFEWLNERNYYSQQDIINFHSTAGKGNNEYGLLMNRNNELCTVSITSIEVASPVSIMQYFDKQTNEVCTLEIPFQVNKQTLIQS